MTEMKLYEKVSPDHSTQSRRVVIDNLPLSVTYTQLMKGLRESGSILSVSIIDLDEILINYYTKSAIVEFRNAKDAADFAIKAKCGKVYHIDENGKHFERVVRLIQTPSYNTEDPSPYNNGPNGQRCVEFPRFPVGWVWFFLEMLGLGKMVEARFYMHRGRDSVGDLEIEFINVQRANVAIEMVRRGRFGFYGFESDHVMTPGELMPFANEGEMTPEGDFLISHVPHDFWSKRWATHPYNQTLGNEVIQNETKKSRDAAPEASVPMGWAYGDSLSEEFQLEGITADDFHHRHITHRDIEYSILGSNIRLTRRAWGWSISVKDEMKLLMSHTLHDPEWTSYWDSYFLSSGSLNIRKYEQYGFLAKHRREQASAQGLSSSTVPVCDCTDCSSFSMNANPMPEIVKLFLFPNARNFIDSQQ